MIRFYGITDPRQQPQAFERPTPSRVRTFVDSIDPYAIASRLFTGNPSRGAVKVIFVRNKKKRVVFRGQQDLIVDLDFDQFF